jgi:monooxygenase
VLVIGSGATAATLVPAMAKEAAHVTMLQRTPTYVLPMPGVDRVAQLLQRWFGEQRAHAWSRRKNLALQAGIYAFCRKYPKAARRLIRRLNVRFLPPGYPVDVHFRPPYDPWRQRLCVVPDADLFVAIREGRASVVTDHIREFTETGVALASGAHLEADLVVTATGLNLQAGGGFPLFLDDRPVAFHEGIVFQGMMLSGVPNLAFAFGYTAASWTLRIAPLGEHFCRLLAHMQAQGHDSCVAVPPPGMATCPLLDLESGYVMRSADLLPRQGPAAPWRLAANHAEDLKLMASAKVDDPHLHFGRAKQAQSEPVAAVAA